MVDDFIWPVEVGAAGEVRHAKLETPFGDGYTQRTKFGIHAKSQKWDITTRGNLAYISAVTAFLDARGEVDSFLWTPPGSAQGRFVAGLYKVEGLGAGYFVLTTTFQQVFHP